MKYTISQIPQPWINIRGKGATVMICDTGCDITHPAIVKSVTEYRSFSQTNLSTHSRHGTHVAGIICGESDQMKGVAPDAKLIVAQIMKGTSGNYEWLLGALRWAASLNVDVLNLSFSYPHDNVEIRTLLMSMSANGTIVSSAYSPYPDIYPSSYPFAVSVGSYADSGLQETSKVDIYAHNEFRSSVPAEKYDVIRGNSMATAYFSGIAALAKGFDKSITKERLLTILKDGKEPYHSNTNFNSSVCR